AKIHPLVGGYGNDITGHNPMLNEDKFYKLFDDIYVGHEVQHIEVAISANSLSEGSLGTITATGTPPATGSPNGQISYVIDFGDGGVELKTASGSSAASFQHRYRQSGTYLATVGASSANGFFGISSRRVTVANEPPTVSIVGGNFTCNLGDSRVLAAR